MASTVGDSRGIGPRKANPTRFFEVLGRLDGLRGGRNGYPETWRRGKRSKRKGVRSTEGDFPSTTSATSRAVTGARGEALAEVSGGQEEAGQGSGSQAGWGWSSV